MRDIFNIIHLLSKEEKRSFNLYLNRTQKSAGNKMVKELYDLVNKMPQGTDQHIQGKLYPNGKKGSYYVLKNRLLDDLEKSLFLMHTGYSDRIKLIYQIGVAKIYINKLLFKEALSLLKKVEKKAEKEGHFDLLMLVYFEITGIAMEYQEVDLGHYLDKQMKVLEQYKKFLQLDQLLKHIAYRLFKSNYAIKDSQLNEILEDIQQKLSLHPTLIQSSKVQFEMHNCIKRVLLQKQDFEGLKIYLIESLNDFESKKLYRKSTHSYKIVHQVWIVNSLFKTFQFEAAQPYIQQLHQSLLAYNKMSYAKYIWTYYQCQYTHFFYSNQLDKAIELLEKIEEEKHHKGLPFYDVFVHLNLTTIYYCHDELTKAMKHLSSLFTKDTYNNLSTEIQFRLALVEAILHFDNQDLDFLNYRIPEVKKQFRKLLQQEDYEREKEFIKIIWKCIRTAAPFEQPRITKMIQTFLQSSPSFEPGSNEAISYLLWLQSKLENKDYYTIVLEQVT